MKYIKKSSLQQIFQNVNTEELQFLQIHSSLLKLKRRQSLFCAGDKPKAFYAVSSGSLKTVRETQTGRSFITSILGPKKLVGFRELFADVAYSRTCIALQDSEVFIISYDAISSIIKNNPNTALDFLKLFSNELIRMENILEINLSQSAKSRLAVILYDSYQMFTKHGSHSFISPLQRKDIAELAGLTPETVSRVLREFKKSKILETTGKHFVVLDPNALKNYVE